jgi:O-antigen/teichoic acid export membrane protein
MSTYRLNLITNIFGATWSAVVQLLCFPVYIHILGIENYGLISFYVTLQVLLQALDLGLSPTMNRQLARYSVRRDGSGAAHDLVRTVEVGYWLLGVAIGVTLIVAAPLISTSWLKPAALSPGAVQRAVVYMGVLIILQWPVSLYYGGLLGLQRQAVLNIEKIVISTLGGIGSVVVLSRISPTLDAFFVWQIVVAALNVTLAATLLWRLLPAAGRAARFDIHAVRSVWRLAAGMNVIAVTGLVLTQTDKLVLSKILSLDNYGYYALSALLAGGLAFITGPIFNAAFPRLSALAATESQAALEDVYHASSQLLSVLLVPVATTLSLLAFEILVVWTRSASIAGHGAPILRVLAAGTALNGLLIMPYALQLAHGWTSLCVRVNLFLIVLLIPTTVFAALRFGGIGSAVVWLLLNCIYAVVSVPLTHRRLLPGHATRWAIADTGGPLVAGVLAATGASLFCRAILGGRLPPLVTIAAVLVTSIAGSIAAAPIIRAHALQWIALAARSISIPLGQRSTAA